MAEFSDDSSDSVKEFHRRKDRFSKYQKSEKVSETRAVIVTDKNLNTKSPPRKRNNSDSSKSPRKTHVGENYRVEKSSDEEQVAGSITSNIKIEQSSSDNTSKDAFSRSHSGARARKNLCVNSEDDEILCSGLDQSFNKSYANKPKNHSSQKVDESPTKSRRILVKHEVRSSEDDKVPSRRDPDKLINQDVLSPWKNLSEFRSSEQEAGDDGSDNEDNFSQNFIQSPLKKRKISIKQEVRSSEDEKAPSLKDPEKLNNKGILSQQKGFSKLKSSKAEADCDSSDRQDDETVFKAQSQRINRYNANKTRNSLSQDIIQTSTKRRGALVKQEVESSEDNEIPSSKDLSELKSSQQEAGANSSDSEILPSQFWIQQFKEVKRNNNKLRLPKMTKKSSPIKNLHSDEDEDDQKTRPSLTAEFNGKKKLSQRKSPPRITKTEIISRKYKRIDQWIVKAKDESNFDKNCHDDLKREKEIIDHLRESSDDNKNDEQVFSQNVNFSGNKFSQVKPDSENITERKSSPAKKMPSPNETRASQKSDLSSELKIRDIDSSIEAKSNVKSISPKKIKKKKHDKPFESRPNICDEDTSSEKKACIDKEKRPQNYILTLGKPRNLINETSNPLNKQLTLVVKSTDQILENEKLNLVKKSRSSSCKPSISHDDNDDANDKYSSEDTSSNLEPKHVIEKKLSTKEKRCDSDSLEDAELLVNQEPTSQEQQIMEQHTSAGLAVVSLRTKLDLGDVLDDEEISPLRDVMKSPVKRKQSQSNSLEIKSNKRARLMSSSTKFAHVTSDSDETDSLTKLNTTLNKSMALMENKSDEIKLSKSGKSVSINTKHKLMHTSNDTRAQRSILKKPIQVAINDDSESISDSLEQNVQQTVQYIKKTPKMIKRPLNLENLKNQESLVHDSTKASFGLEYISDDDEIYIVNIPRTVDPRELKGQTIRLGGKNKLQIGTSLYETCDDAAKNVSCVFRTNRDETSYKTVNLKLAGCINVRQKLSRTLHIRLSAIERTTMPFPKNLKTRHPLFGVQYKDKIVMADRKVLEQTFKSITKQKSITKKNEACKVDPKPIKLKNAEKHQNKKVEHSQNLEESANISRGKVRKTQEVHSHDLASNGSDSDVSGESFFQKVKRTNNMKHENRKKSKSLSSISILDKTPLTTDLTVYSEKKITTAKREDVAAKKKLGLSLNSFALKHDGFGINTKNSKFFSSTPIKFESDNNYEREN